MATLELRNVNKTYGAGLPDTLKNIELSIKEGEFLILVGPSGCGKSTLMNCIAGLENITGGDRKRTRLNSSHLVISYAVFCLTKKHPSRRVDA